MDRAAFLFSVLLAAGCNGMPEPQAIPVRNPMTITVPSTLAVRDVTEIVGVALRDYGVASYSFERGFVATAWRDQYVPVEHIIDRWTASVTSGQIVIGIECEHVLAGVDWPCSEPDRQRDWVRAMPALAAGIRTKVADLERSASGD